MQFGRTILRPGYIELHLRNTSPQSITVAQISINEATWPFAISPGPTIPRLGSAVVTLDYPWVQAEAYEITLHSANSIAFPTSIPVATTTAGVSARTLWSFSLIGIYVGIVPVVLGMFWLPVLARLGAARHDVPDVGDGGTAAVPRHRRDHRSIRDRWGAGRPVSGLRHRRDRHRGEPSCSWRRSAATR